ncbi:MAG TPA: type II secretion system protein N [Gemmataceae bacterium]|nr:type II secretion system protein N [Gemmataceae bacterium]
MPRRLIVLNVVLGLASLALTVGIVRALLVKRPIPPPATVRTVAPAPPSPAAAPAPKNPEAYAIIADQNLFNPARSEKASVAVAVVKPILHGIVIEGTKSRAFLEDPTMKRVGAYSVGDAVSGGTLQKIADDRVVIARPEGLVEVLLQDPSKPKPVPVAAAGPPVTAAPRAAPPEGIPSGPAVTVPPPPGGAVPPAQTVPVQVPPVQAPPAQVGPSPTGAPPADQSSADLSQLRRRLLRLPPATNQ